MAGGKGGKGRGEKEGDRKDGGMRGRGKYDQISERFNSGYSSIQCPVYGGDSVYRGKYVLLASNLKH